MLTMQIPQRDGDGYLVDMSDWTPEIGRLMAKADGYELNDRKWQQIMKARLPNTLKKTIRRYSTCG